MKKYEGKVNMAVGLAKQKLGELTGNKTLEREGQYQKLKGATQDTAENAKAVVRSASKTALKTSLKGRDAVVQELNSALSETNKAAQRGVKKAGDALEAGLVKAHKTVKSKLKP